MKKLLSLLATFASLFSLSSCGFELGFEPAKLYKFSACLKYTIDNSVLQEEPEIKLFTSYENMCSYFDEYTYPYGYGSGNREQANKDILENIDFEKSNLLGYMIEEGTGSTLHAVSVIENNITIYFYTPEIVTDDMAYKWLIVEVDKKFEFSELNIKTKDMNESQAKYLYNNFASEYRF